MNQFGFASLDIDYVNVSDAGVYEMIVTNITGLLSTV
jgi:hypothetical protein